MAWTMCRLLGVVLVFSFAFCVTDSTVVRAPEPSSSPAEEDPAWREREPQFLMDAVYPTEPAPATVSSYCILEELNAWAELAPFNALLSLYPDVRQTLSSNDSHIVFAPTAGAIASFIAAVRDEITRRASEALATPDVDDHDDQPVKYTQRSEAAKASPLMLQWSQLAALPVALPALRIVLLAHLARGDWSEESILANGSLLTFAGSQLRTNEFPSIFSNGSQARRVYRQVVTSNGRLSVVDSILLPAKLTDLINVSVPVPELEDEPNLPPALAGLPIQFLPALLPSLLTGWSMPAPPQIPPFDPFHSLVSFIAMRTDLSIFSALVATSPGVAATITRTAHSRSLHIFAPTNDAFIHTISMLSYDASNNLADSDIAKNITTDLQSALRFARIVSRLWESMEGIPSLKEALLYHVADTGESVAQLAGKGRIETLVPNSSVRIDINGEVHDGDASRSPAHPIASYPTLQGFVTPIDDLLTPFDLRAAQVVLAAALNESDDMNHMEQSEASDAVFEDYDGDDGDTPLSTPNAGDGEMSCFPSDALVAAVDGFGNNQEDIHMAMLQAGQIVAVDELGTSSRVFAFTHRDEEYVGPFVEITFANRVRALTLSPGHYVFANGALTAASAVAVGDSLPGADGSSALVTRVRMVEKKGRFAPHTLHGDIVVDGIVVSTYSTSVHPILAHALLAPVRLFSRLTGVKEPLRSLFYKGGGILATWVPKGSIHY